MGTSFFESNRKTTHTRVVVHKHVFHCRVSCLSKGSGKDAPKVHRTIYVVTCVITMYSEDLSGVPERRERCERFGSSDLAKCETCLVT